MTTKHSADLQEDTIEEEVGFPNQKPSEDDALDEVIRAAKKAVHGSSSVPQILDGVQVPSAIEFELTPAEDDPQLMDEVTRVIRDIQGSSPAVHTLDNPAKAIIFEVPSHQISPEDERQVNEVLQAIRRGA